MSCQFWWRKSSIVSRQSSSLLYHTDIIATALIHLGIYSTAFQRELGKCPTVTSPARPDRADADRLTSTKKWVAVSEYQVRRVRAPASSERIPSQVGAWAGYGRASVYFIHNHNCLTKPTGAQIRYRKISQHSPWDRYRASTRLRQNLSTWSHLNAIHFMLPFNSHQEVPTTVTWLRTRSHQASLMYIIRGNVLAVCL